VHHGINAVTGDRPSGIPLAHHVLFNHPHLGLEDAALHAQFLCHLFHAVYHTWMVHDADGKAAGFFHITLVKGQFERWKCQEAAQRHGMELLVRHSFRSPRVPNPYFQHRRHQTGKSFAARAATSETYTFVRRKKKDSETPDDSSKAAENLFVAALLDLPTKDDAAAMDQSNHYEDSADNGFPCPHCNKSFREERSRKNHINSVHPDGNDGCDEDTIKKRKWEGGKVDNQKRQQTYACSLCQDKDGHGPRIFKSAQALEDHRKAKHLAAHPFIQPDWHRPNTSDEQQQQGAAITKPITSYCEICGVSLPGEKARRDHLQAFLPSDIAIAESKGATAVPLSYQCNYCQKAFREHRAQKQHENYCSSRQSQI
jgi:uncharacterized C2H2 Zn-finger protein